MRWQIESSVSFLISDMSSFEGGNKSEVGLKILIEVVDAL